MKQSSLILADVLERITDAFVAFDKNWCYTYANKKAAAILKCTPAELIGKNVWELFPESVGLPFHKAYMEAMDTQEYTFLEEHYKPLNKRFENHIYPSPEGLSVFIHETTGRKKAEQELQMAHQQLTQHLNNTPLAIIEWDKNFIIQKWSAQAEHIFGWKEAEVVNKHFNELNLVFEEDAVGTGIIAQELMTGAVDQNKNINRNNTKTGKVIYCQWFNSVLKDEKGNVSSILSFIEDITKIKKVEAALVESENHLRTILQTEPECVKILGRKGQLLSMNPAGLGMIDADNEEQVVGYRMTELVNTKYRTAFKRLTTEVFKGNSGTLEFEITGLKGSHRWLETHAVPLKDAEGKIISLLGLTRDITERKKKDEEIRVSEELYKDLVDHITDLICTHDLDGRIFSMNRASEKAIGLNFEQLKNFNIKDILTSGTKKKYDGYIADILENGYARGIMKVKNRFGETRTWEFNNSLKPAGANSPPLIRGHARDITEQAEAEEAIRKSEIKYRTVVENIHEALMVEDVKGNLLYANDEFCRMFGYTQEETKNLSLKDYTATLSLAEVKKRHYRRMNGNKESEEFEYKGRRKDGTEFWIECRVSTLLENGKIIGTQSLERDITKQKKADEEIRKSNETLRQLTAHLQNIREEERKRIGREIHDELGQQLTAIKMDVAWIDKKIPGGFLGADNLTAIKAKLKNIINLLDGSNQSLRKILNELRPDVLDDYGLVDALEWQGRQFTESTGIEIKFNSSQTEAKLPQHIANCIFRVYQESLTNIMRYARATKVLTSLSIKDDSIMLTVKDNGKGFNTTSIQNKKSFGILGMRERVLSLNGKFELVSAKGKGTKIVVKLPHNK